MEDTIDAILSRIEDCDAWELDPTASPDVETTPDLPVVIGSIPEGR